MTFLQRLRLGGNLFIFFGGILLALFLCLLIAVVFFGQTQLREVAQQRASSELEKQAAALDYFFNEQENALREVADGHAIKAYLANQALGMSMEYGLRTSLLQVAEQLQGLKKREEVHGNPVYRRLTFFDLEGRALADNTDVMPNDIEWNRAVPLPALNVTLLLANSEGCLSACLVVPVIFKDNMTGFLVADIDFQDVLGNLFRGGLHGLGNRLVLRNESGALLFQSDSTPGSDQDEVLLRTNVSGINLVLETSFRLEDAERYLVSRWLPGAISILTLPLFLGLGYLLHLNNQNLVLKTEHAADQEKWGILSRQRDVQRLISQTTANLLETPSTEMNGAIETALQRTGKQCGADRAYLFLVSDDKKHISNTHEWCAPGIAPQRDKIQGLPLEDIPWWWAQISQKEIIIVPNVGALPPEAVAEKAIFEDQQIKSLFAFPLRRDGRTIGFVGYDAVHRRTDWTAEEIELLQVMTDIIVSALARWQIETELTVSEEKMRDAQAYAHLGHWSLSPETKTAEWSDEIYRIVGLSPDITAGPETLKRLVHPADNPCVIDSLEKSLSQATEHNLDYRIIRPDGDERWVNCRAKPVMDTEGRVTKLEGFFQDITERKHAEIQQHESETLFFKAFQAAGTLMTITLLDTGVLEKVNDTFVETTGYSRAEAIGKSSVELGFISSDTREELKHQILRDGSLRNLELHFTTKEGHTRYCLYNGEIVEIDGMRKLLSIVQDITSLKQSQRQSEEQRKRAQQYLDVAGVMLIALDRSGRVTLINPKGCDLLGLPEKKILGRDWFERFLPEGDRRRFRTDFDQLMSGRIGLAEYTESPILTSLRSQRLIAWHNNVIHDAAGRIAGTLSSGEDVTERRKAEQALRGERAFLQHVIDGIDDPILVISPEHKVLRMNRTAQNTAERFGLDASHVTCHTVTHQCNEPCSGEDRPCPLRTVLNTGLPCKVLHKRRTRNGELQTLEIAASPLLDDDDHVVGTIEVSRDISEHLALLDELKERDLRYSHLAQHDPLTGLPNRLLFADRLSQAIHTAHRSSTKLGVLYIDLDQFKQVNDSFDHSYGDEVLRAVASRLQTLFREDDTIARMGGDEFTLILTNIHHDEDAALVSRKILHLFQEPFEIQGHGVFLSASIGISMYPHHGLNVDDLVRNADTAMYHAKEDGRNTFRYYSEELTTKAFERVLLESHLHRVVDRGELVLHYQPQFNLVTADLCGLEALVRWQHPDMGLVSPATFIPLAEDSGIIVSMGAWILREACRQMKAWQDAGIVACEALISVNLSAKQFDQSDLIEMIGEILHDTGLNPHSLELEITESTMMRSPDLSGFILQQLRNLGVKIAIDDFGTGYSSMSHLKLLPLTKLKIDKSFISDIPQDTNDIAITKAVIALAQSLALDVLAEGVETEEQRAFLTLEGCRSGQGYLFSWPLRAKDFESYMQGRGA